MFFYCRQFVTESGLSSVGVIIVAAIDVKKKRNRFDDCEEISEIELELQLSTDQTQLIGIRTEVIEEAFWSELSKPCIFGRLDYRCRL